MKRRTVVPLAAARLVWPESVSAQTPGRIRAGCRWSSRNQIESDKLAGMKTLTVTEVARNFSAVLDSVERRQEEVVLVRNHRRIARLVPEPPAGNALEVLGDLYRTLDERTADALAAAVDRAKKRKRGTLAELRDPWAS
jgi:antitoxin (DNA-binding transcriptional repressor) of toxin-antitoxin stability system